MIRKAISVAAMIVAAAFMFALQPASKADTLNACAVTGHSTYEVYTNASVTSDANGVNGWAFLMMADGSYMGGQFGSLKVNPNGDVKGVVYGYFDGYLPVEVDLTIKAGQVTIKISDYFSGANYMDSEDSNVMWGGFQSSK